MIDRSLLTGARQSGGRKSLLLMGTALAGALVVPLMGEVRPAQAACNVGGVGGGTVSCDNTATTDTTFTLPPFSPVAVNDRAYKSSVPLTGTVNSGKTITDYGLEFQNTTGGTVNVTNNGAISQTFLPVNTVGTAALSVFGTGGAVTIFSRGPISSTVATGIETTNCDCFGPGNISLTTTGTVTGRRDGISAAASGIVTVVASGAVTGQGGFGIGAFGDSVIVSTSGTVSGLTAGIQADNFGGGNISITTTGLVSGGEVGIFANAGGIGKINVIAGDVIANGNGVETVTANGLNTVTALGLIRATANGVDASATGTGGVKVDTSVGQIGVSAASRVGGIGVSARSTGSAGDVTVNAGSIYSTGHGVSAVIGPSASTGHIAVTVNGTIDSASGNGVDARISNAASSGNIGVSSSGNIVTGTTGIGVNAINSGLGTVSVSNTGTVNSAGIGISTASSAGQTTITNSGTVVGAGTGAAPVISATTSGGLIAIGNASGGVIRSASNSPSDRAISTSGGSTTLTNAGTLTGSVFLGGTTNAVTNSGTWTAGGTSVIGGTVNNSGTLAIKSGGTFGGISTLANSGTLTNDGTLTTSGGTTNSGALTNTGAINGGVSNSNTFTNSGTLNGGLANIAGTATNSGTVNGGVSNSSSFANSGTVSGGLTNTAGTTTNNGTIGGGATVSGGALNTSNTVNGGLTNSATVNASGAINGAIDNKGAGVFTVTGPLTASSTFTNEGAASLVVSGGNFTGITALTNSSTAARGISVGAGRTLSAGSVSNLGGATIDLATASAISSSADFQNSGTIRTPVAGTSAAVNTGGTFSNNSTGLINLQNGSATDRLTINGNYVGAVGSRIALDFHSQSNTADQVVITGNASGITGLNVINLTPGAAFSVSPLLVQVNGTSTATFALANAQNFGAVSVVALPQTNAAGQSGIALATVPNATGLSGAIALTAAQTIAFQSSDIVLDRLSEVREEQRKQTGQQVAELPGNAMAYAKMPVKANPIQVNDPVNPTVKPAMWVRAFGDFEDRTGQANFVFGGQNFGADLGYRQRSGGVMAGSDVVISRLTSAQDGLILGVLAGYLNSHVGLRAAPTTLNFSGLTVGGYGTYFNGPWYTDVMVKFDALSLDVNGPGVFQTADVKNYSVIANVGYKIDLPNRYYIEPTAGVDFVHTSFDHLSVLAAPQNVPLANGEATRVRIGARIGTDWITNNVRIEPSLTGFAYEIVDGSNAALFVNGAGITLPSDQGKVRGELQGAVSFLNVQTGWSGFVRADTRFGDQLFAAGGRGGIRYQW